MIDVWNIRKDFPCLHQSIHEHRYIYLDSAATTHKPQSVIDAMTRFYAESYGTVHRAIYHLAAQATSHYETARESVRKFLGAKHREEIIFVKGTTEGINLVAHSFGKAYIKPSDEIIISETEHHANIVPWQLLCQERGAVLRVVPVDDRGDLILEQYEKLLSEKTRLVSIAHIANATGATHPVEEIIQMAHAKGAFVLLDAAQSAAHTPLDVSSLDVDFLVFSGHKALGPTGIGVLYGKKHLLDEMPPYQTGGDMIDTVRFDKTSFQPPPLRFEAGTPNIAGVIGLGAAISYIEQIGREKIRAYEELLTEHACRRLESIPGVRLIGMPRHRAPIISFVCKDAHPLDVGTLLDLKGVSMRTGHHCAQPTMARFGVSSTIRLSLAVYNTIEEIDLMSAALEETLLLLRGV